MTDSQRAINTTVNNTRAGNIRGSNYSNVRTPTNLSALWTLNCNFPKGGDEGSSVMATTTFGQLTQVANYCINPGPGGSGLHFPVSQLREQTIHGLASGNSAVLHSLGTPTEDVPTDTTVETKGLPPNTPTLANNSIVGNTPNPFLIGSFVLGELTEGSDGFPTTPTSANSFAVWPSLGGTSANTFNTNSVGGNFNYHYGMSESLGTGKHFTKHGDAKKASTDAAKVENKLDKATDKDSVSKQKDKEKREKILGALIKLADKFLPESLTRLKDATFCLINSDIKSLWQKDIVIDTAIDKGLSKFGQIVNTVQKVASVVKAVLPVASAVIGFISPSGKANDVKSVTVNNVEMNLKDFTVTLNYKQRIERLNTFIPTSHHLIYVEGQSLTIQDKVFSVDIESPGFNAELLDIVTQLNVLLPQTERLNITWEKGIISNIEVVPGITINSTGKGLIVDAYKLNPITIGLKDLNCFLQGNEELINSILEEEPDPENRRSLIEKIEGYLDIVASVPGDLTILNLFSKKFLPFPVIDQDGNINGKGFLDYGIGKVNNILPSWAQINVDLENQAGSIGPINISAANGELKVGVGDLGSLLGKIGILNKLDWIPFLSDILKDIKLDLSFPLDPPANIPIDTPLIDLPGTDTGTVNTADPKPGVGGDDTITNSTNSTPNLDGVNTSGVGWGGDSGVTNNPNFVLDGENTSGVGWGGGNTTGTTISTPDLDGVNTSGVGWGESGPSWSTPNTNTPNASPNVWGGDGPSWSTTPTATGNTIPGWDFNSSKEPPLGTGEPTTPTPSPAPAEGVGGDDTIATTENASKEESGEEGTINTSGLTTAKEKMPFADAMQVVSRVMSCISDLFPRNSSTGGNKRNRNAVTNTNKNLRETPKCEVISLSLPKLSEKELLDTVGTSLEKLEENTNGEVADPNSCKLVEVEPGFVGPIPCVGELVPCKLIEVNKDFIGPIPCVGEGSNVVGPIQFPVELPNSVFDLNKSKLSLPENNNTYKTARTDIPKKKIIDAIIPYSRSTIETIIEVPGVTNVTSVNGLTDNVNRTITLKGNKGAIRITEDGEVRVRIRPIITDARTSITTFPTVEVPYTTRTSTGEDEMNTIIIKVDPPDLSIGNTIDGEDSANTVDIIDRIDTSLEILVKPATNPIINPSLVPLLTPLINEVLEENTTVPNINIGKTTKPIVRVIKSPTSILNIPNSSGTTKAIPNRHYPVKKEVPLISRITVVNDDTKKVEYDSNPSTEHNLVSRLNTGTNKTEYKSSDRLIIELEELGIEDSNSIVNTVGRIIDSAGKGILNKFEDNSKKFKPKYVHSGNLLELLALIMLLSNIDQAQVWGGAINTLVPNNPNIIRNTKTFLSNQIPLGCSRLINLYSDLDGSQESLDNFIINYLGYPRLDVVRLLNDPKYVVGYLLDINPRLVPAIEYLMLGDIPKFFNELIYYRFRIDTIQEGIVNNINSLVSTAYGIPS